MAQPLYSTSFNIAQFNGINQSGDGYNMNMQYAREMENVNIDDGSFQSMREGKMIEQTLEYSVGTLASISPRYGPYAGKTVLVAVSNGYIWTKVLDEDDQWDDHLIQYITSSGHASNREVLEEQFSWITYEVNSAPDYDPEKVYKHGERCVHSGETYRCNVISADDPFGEWDDRFWEEIENDPVDVLLLSNTKDGMICVYGDYFDIMETPVVPDPSSPSSVIRFGEIARYNERIWGTGIEGDPDKLMYSAPYDPFDWTQNDEIPEDGAGDILQPTWDGDQFMALRQFGSSLIAVKRNSLWRIYGTDPGSFTIQMQYGGGTIEARTLEVYGEYAYMLGENGIMVYNGNSVMPFMQESIQTIMRERASRQLDEDMYPEFIAPSVSGKDYFVGDRCKYEGVHYRCKKDTNRDVVRDQFVPSYWEAIDPNPMHYACSGMWNGIYCLAIPINGSDFCNAMIQYDTNRRTFSLRTEISVKSFMQINERLFYTTHSTPGLVYELDDRFGKTKHVKWVSGYQDLGMKSSIKSAFVVYMNVETEAPVELRIGIRTEKKLKQKIITVKPNKTVRTHLNLSGRIFRLEISSYSAVPFTIAGGIKVDLELDPD